MFVDYFFFVVNHSKSYMFGKSVYFPLDCAIVNGVFSIVLNFYMEKVKLLVICG